jgi:hypothetical protein
MPIYTVNQVVAQVRRRLPDAEATDLVDKVNQIHRQILSEIPEARRTSLDISVTAGTQEYAIANEFFQVESAYWVTAASGEMNQLAPASVEGLNVNTPKWRTQATGLPKQVYLSAAIISTVQTEVLGLYPAPNVTTAMGYPVVRAFGSMLQTGDLIGGDSTLPTLHSSQVYVEGASYLCALEVRQQLVGMYKAEFEYQLDLAKTYVRTRLELLKGVATKNIRGGGYLPDVP